MSLNKFSNQEVGYDLKLNVGADYIKCNNLEVLNPVPLKGGPLYPVEANPLAPPTIDSVDMTNFDGVVVRCGSIGALATLQSLNEIRDLGRLEIYFYGPFGGSLTVKHNTTAGTGKTFQLATMADQVYTIDATRKFVKLEAIYSAVDGVYFLQELTTPN